MKIEAKINDGNNKNICAMIRAYKPSLFVKTRNPKITGTQKRKEKEKERLSTLRRNKRSIKK